MTWIFEKFQGDIAIYAFCPKCNFHHTCNTKPGLEIIDQYRYCPMCGEYLYNESSEIDVIWNQKHITDLYEMERNNEY